MAIWALINEFGRPGLSNFAQTPVAPCAYNISFLKPEGPAVERMAMRAIWNGVLIAASTAVGMTDVYAQGIEYGKNDYVKFCVQCHGETGKGDGRFAKSLKRPPGDLTKLSENNGGVFPSARIYDVIDGRVEVMDHGKRDMPVWGNVFTDELTAQLPRDSMSKESSDYRVRRRILSIIEYISTLQGK